MVTEGCFVTWKISSDLPAAPDCKQEEFYAPLHHGVAAAIAATASSGHRSRKLSVT